MSYSYGNSSNYTKVSQTWVNQKKYTLSTNKENKEKFGSFSISAAVRPPYSRKWANPWERQQPYYGVS
jgi:hypothetical protein